VGEIGDSHSWFDGFGRAAGGWEAIDSGVAAQIKIAIIGPTSAPDVREIA
jgi:hypothetical protein